MIANIAARGGLSLNGIAPVKAYVRVNDCSSYVSPNRLSATDLNCNHRERENISFLAIRRPAVQNLWRDPSCTVADLGGSALGQIQVLSDHCDTKICDLCTTGDVHDDIRLAERQYGDEKGSKTTTHSCEIPVNQAVEVEVVEACRSVG